MNLAQEFQLAAMKNAQTAMLAHGCPTKRLLGELETRGGAEVLRQLAARRRLSDGFDALVRCGHPELTLEALAVQRKYGTLFTDDEVNWCLDALLEAGFF